MLMLAPSTAVTKVSVVLGSNGGSGIAPALCRRLGSVGGGGTSEVRQSPVLDSWHGLTDVCKGADMVYLLSALDLPRSPDDADLQAFRKGVSRVLQCCQECGVESLVFTSSSSVVAGRDKLDHISDGDSLPYIGSQEDATAHAVAMAEAEILKASGTQNVGGSSCLHTCALRPATVYGTAKDRWLHRALSWVGLGLNRVSVGAKDLKSEMVFADNLVEAQALAGASLAQGTTPDFTEGGVGRNKTRGPACSGNAYFISDGQSYNPQRFLDGILDGLDFPTSKIARVPTGVALFTALVAELACKLGITGKPLWTRTEVRRLTENRTFSIARAQKDLGYSPRISPETAMKKTVDTLKLDGWTRHVLSEPSIGHKICNPLGIWLVTLAGFGGPCPPFLAPLANKAEYVGLFLLHELSIVRAVCVAVYLIHVLEGMYAFRVAQRAGHRDTAPLWFLQTFIIGFPSITLVNRLKLDSA